MKNIVLIPEERIAGAIFVMRGQKVMLDSDLAKLYGVTTGNLNLAVKRNSSRFPSDFMFKSDKREQSLLLQFAISKTRGGRQTVPYVFTEHGVAMLSSVLRSERAVQINIAIMRAFARYRQILMADRENAIKLLKHDKILEDHDKNIRYIIIAIKRLMTQPEPKRTPIGFGANRKKK